MNRASRAAVLELVAVFAVFAVLDALRIRLTLPRGLFGDEWRYLYYADNLLHGFYSPPERVYIVNGPGYPLLLLPFVARGWTEGARYANAVWHAGTMVYAWAVLRPYLRLPWRIVAVAALGWYGPLVAHVPLLYTEVVCCFFVSGWLYHALRSQRVAAGLYLGALCMTKVIFGMGLVVFVALTAGVWLYRRSPLVARHLIISLLALALCVPFETYTHRLTGRWLYWSSSGGNNFYWLTSPYPEESGDWYHHGWVRDNAMLRAHHRAVFDEASGLRDQPNLDEKEQFFNLGRPEAADVFLREG
ncbi:MAG TPA: hypothetical protein VJR89_38725, partial [Polyangiales bacterium]|nr:hypothetical protein [Polyangiales bacterium]